MIHLVYPLHRVLVHAIQAIFAHLAPLHPMQTLAVLALTPWMVSRAALALQAIGAVLHLVVPSNTTVERRMSIVQVARVLQYQSQLGFTPLVD